MTLISEGAARTVKCKSKPTKPASRSREHKSPRQPTPRVTMEKIGERKLGTVKFFNPAKGYGFIMPDNASVQVFVHAVQLETTGLQVLIGGQRVEYQMYRILDGIRAGKECAGDVKIIR